MNPVFEPLIDRVMTILDRLFLLRPPLFFPVWIATAAGLGVGRWVSESELFWHVGWNIWILLLFVGMTLISGAALVLTQVAQAGTRSFERSLSVIDKGSISPDRARRLAWIYLAVGLVLVLPSGALTVVAALILFLAWGGLDSVMPPVLRAHPLAQTARHLLAAASLFYVGWGASGAALTPSPGLALPYILGFGGIGALMTLSSEAPSPSRGSRPGTLRLIVTILAATASVVVALVLGYANGDPIISTAAALALPFFVVALIYRRDVDTARTIRYALLIVAIFVGVRYPLLFIPLVINFYLCRTYYQRRFGVVYPTFQADQELLWD